MAQPKVVTQLTGFGEGFGDIQKQFWIVDNETDARILEDKTHQAIYVNLSDGSPITDWTAAKGTGNWDAGMNGEDDSIPMVKMTKAYVAFRPQTMKNAKALKFIDALRDELIARGGGLKVLTVPNGQTVGELAQKHFGEYLIAAMTPEEEGDEDGAKEDKELTDADKLLMIAKADFNFHWSDEDGGFLTLKKGPQFAYIVSGGTPSLRNYLVNAYLDKYGAKVPSRTMVSDAMNALEALCDASDSRVRKLSIRAARSLLTNKVWIDLGRLDGLCISISAEGLAASVISDPDVFFKRTDQVKELPVPSKVSFGDAQDVLKSKLRPYFNISDEEWPMVCAWMVTQIVPDFSAPVAMFLGKSGSGKTTATSILSTILENVKDNGALMPEGKDNLAVTISQEKISIWNNVSKIGAQTSDDICQYIDGASYRKRKLHSNNDVVSMTLEPSILLNGISFEEDLRADLKTRSVIFNMAVMEGATGSIDDIINEVKKNHADILGAIYTLCVQVFKEFPDAVLPEGGSRMAEYLKTILIIDKLWGLGDTTYKRYMKSSSEMSVESIELGVFKALHRQIVKEENLKEGIYEATFTNDEIIGFLSDYSTSDFFGTRVGMELMDLKLDNAKKMTAYLNRHITDWNKFGISYIDHGNTMVDGVRATRKSFYFDYAKSEYTWDNHIEAERKIAANTRF